MTTQQAIIRAIPAAEINATSNVRLANGYDNESLKDLASSIKEHGLLQPVVVRECEADDKGRRYIVIAGRRRVMACILNDMETVPCLIVNTDEAKAYEMEIAENIQREQMTLADTARAVRTLMMIYNKGATVARILGKSAAWVSKHLSITSANVHPVVADWMETGMVQDLETLISLDKLMRDTSPKAVELMAKELPDLHRLAEAGHLTRSHVNTITWKLKQPEKVTTVTTPETTKTTKEAGQGDLLRAKVEYDPSSEGVIKVSAELAEAWEAAVQKHGVNSLLNQLDHMLKSWGNVD